MNRAHWLFGGVLLMGWAAGAGADEGMWLFSDPPTRLLKDRYGFEPTPAWLEHVRKSSVRFNSGGSGSFISADGLVMTNHHVGADALQKMSTKEKDFIQTGYYAKTRADEVKCADLELNVLMEIEDVSERVNAAIEPSMTPAEAQKARRGVINTIEKESLDKTGFRSDVITLYNGGAYHLYRFKKYTDVRLVFAPEKDIAFFGGDPDNFEYPRYDLDVCFFRAYENQKPARIEHFLKWSAAGAAENELIFVSGHPGRTNRLNTVAHLEFLRDRSFPFQLNLIRRREVLLRGYSERSIENARRAQDELFGYQNSRKARLGGLAGLQDPAIFDKKRADEDALRAQVAKGNPEWKKNYGSAWADVAAALEVQKRIFVDFSLLERGSAFNSELFHIARQLVRLADESKKPNAERLPEYAEAGLESLRLQLFSDAPIYADLETAKLADSLGMMLEFWGPEHDLARQILGKKSPTERAAELVAGSRLADVGLRKKLADEGPKAVRAAADPMIELALLVDPLSRKLRKTYDEQVDEPMKQAYGKIAKARFAVHGKSTYPDATFTLRLAFGTVKGYEIGGRKFAPWTTMGGTFRHAQEHANQPPFALPQSWLDKRSTLAGDTPFNFVSTADIIGGNSGSPVINRAGELVGIIFDGNIESLVLDFVYTDQVARAISVHSAAILEALDKIYGAKELVAEIRP